MLMILILSIESSPLKQWVNRLNGDCKTDHKQRYIVELFVTGWCEQGAGKAA